MELLKERELAIAGSKGIANVIGIVFIMLFMYTATNKLWDFTNYKGEMLNQATPLVLNRILVWLVPLAEIVVSILLVFSRTQKAGFWGSVFLMVLFTGYTGLVFYGFFERVPCTCGGVFELLGWGEHFVVNIILMFLAVAGVWSSSPTASSESIG